MNAVINTKFKDFHVADITQADWGRRVYTIAALYAGDADEGEALLQPLRELGDMVMDERTRSPDIELLENDVMSHIRSMMHDLDERAIAPLDPPANPHTFSLERRGMEPLNCRRGSLAALDDPSREIITPFRAEVQIDGPPDLRNGHDAAFDNLERRSQSHELA